MDMRQKTFVQKRKNKEKLYERTVGRESTTHDSITR